VVIMLIQPFVIKRRLGAVHALYRKNSVSVLLSGLLFIELLVATVGTAAFLPKVDFSPTCFATMPTRKIVLVLYGFAFCLRCESVWLTPSSYRVIMLSTQAFVFFLTVAKHFTSVRSPWSHIPIVSLLIRDGAFAFVTIFGKASQPFLRKIVHPHICTTI